MPTPSGDITTSGIWTGNGNDNQTTQTQEAEQVQEESDTAEQAVGESDSEE